MTAIAIDGPSGAGKSTMAKSIARELGYIYVDTGALYRAIGLYAVENGIQPNDREALMPELGNIKVRIVYIEGEQHVMLNGRDVSVDIRSAKMGMAASDVSAIPEVRAFLLGMQRDIAAENNVVMDGRDIATVVLPDAKIKIFLTASVEDRARRRHLELVAKGEDISYNSVLEDMRIRDRNDSSRNAAPLKKADDAILVDTTGMSLEAAVEMIIGIVKDCESR